MIRRRGFSDRLRCFDIEFPFILQVPRLECVVHKNIFNVVHHQIVYPENFFLLCDSKPISILAFERTLLVCILFVLVPYTFQTRSFYQYLIDLYFEIHNFESITRTVKDSWMHSWKTYLWQLKVLGQQIPSSFDVAKLFQLSSGTVKNCIIYWWHSEGYDKLKD